MELSYANPLSADGAMSKYTPKTSLTDKTVMSVHETKNYKQFRLLEGNRQINLVHLNRLIDSFSSRPLMSIVIVNEKMEVIDGQHRISVAKELGLPVYYIIMPGYGLDEIHTLNANQRNWNADDFLAGYCSKGYEHYLAYRDFKSEFGFGHNETRTLLTGLTHSGHNTAFYEGRFEIVDLDRAYKWAEMLRSLAPYYDGWKRRSFVNALITVFKRPQFSFDRLIQKLKAQPTRLKDCVDVGQYTELLEEIYNYRCSDKNKVNLRF